MSKEWVKKEDLKNMVNSVSNIPLDEFTEKALAVRFNKERNRYELISLLYDYKTKNAIVDKVMDMDSKQEAINKFKITSNDYGFIG